MIFNHGWTRMDTDKNRRPKSEIRKKSEVGRGAWRSSERGSLNKNQSRAQWCRLQPSVVGRVAPRAPRLQPKCADYPRPRLQTIPTSQTNYESGQGTEYEGAGFDSGQFVKGGAFPCVS
jgi:hypothetical protein